MRPLGQILCNGERIENACLFDVIGDIADAVDGCPLLIVGYERAKSLIKGFNPLKKRYDGNVFWTFGRYENRTQHETDLKAFSRAAVEVLTQCVDYTFVNTNMLPLSRIKNLLRYFSTDRNFYYYLSSDCHGDPSFIHVFDISAGRVFGFSVSTLTSFHNVKAKNVFRWLDRHPNMRRKQRGFTFGRDVRRIIGYDTMTDLVLWTLMYQCTDEEFRAHRRC